MLKFSTQSKIKEKYIKKPNEWDLTLKPNNNQSTLYMSLCTL